MKKYSYFPGCALTAEGFGKAFDWSIKGVNRILDLEFTEIPDWNCCGTVPYDTLHEAASFAVCARNLALAEKMEGDLIAPCSSCYVFLSRTNQYLKQYPKVKSEVDSALAAGGLEYHGKVKVRKVLDAYVNDVGLDAIAAKVTRNLEGLKVACYYGCQEVRPIFGHDHPEFPKYMDKLIKALGAEPTNFPLKSRCCGGSLIISEEDASLELIKKLLDSAIENGAEVMVTGCPLCQLNVDAYQVLVNKKYKTNYHLPVLFFTQLMGLAFGLEEKDLGLKTSIVPVKKALAKFI
ncbi:MAG: CoB--CoM heterodisulfide reductase iron-sulfur subunit B family protein [Dehalococcoidales bacterium]